MSEYKKMEIEIHHEKHEAEREYRKDMKDLRREVKREALELGSHSESK